MRSLTNIWGHKYLLLTRALYAKGNQMQQAGDSHYKNGKK